MNYTKRIGGYQIRDVAFLFDDYKDERIPLEFDIVKWQQHEPLKALDMRTGKETVSTESCYSIGTLVWNPREPTFYMKTVGMRWFEEGVCIPLEFISAVIAFSSRMEFLLEKYGLMDATIADIPRIRELWEGRGDE